MSKTYRKLSKKDKQNIKKLRKLKNKKYEEAYSGNDRDKSQRKDE